MKNLRIPTTLAVSVLASCGTTKRSLPTDPQKPNAQGGTTWQAPISAMPRFDAEAAYIAKRRKAVGLEVKQGWEAIALCLSGGGERSATVQIGVLQGLQEKGLLKKADYISCASGGAYTGAWYVSHLLKPESGERTVSSTHWPLQHKSEIDYTTDPAQLMQPEKRGSWEFNQTGKFGPVDQLEDGRGFVFGRKNWRVPLDLAWVGLTAPLNALMDVALHLKIPRGKSNAFHPNLMYDNFLRWTYLRKPHEKLPGQEDDLDGFFKGKPHTVRMDEINPDGSPAPYLVIGASLCASPPGHNMTDPDVLPFEFSRDSCGAPFLGYIEAKHFGFPVKSVTKDELGGGMATLKSHSLVWWPWPTKPLNVDAAVSASGAAFDSLSVFGKIRPPETTPKPAENGLPAGYRDVWPPVGTQHKIPFVKPAFAWLDYLISPLNLNLRYHNRNFAMQVPRQPQGAWTWKETLKDRMREFTSDRISATTESNTLFLTDGGHYDNLGIFAMSLRPQVTQMWVFDAGCDPKYEFDDLKRALALLSVDGWHWQAKGWTNSGEPLAPFQMDCPAVAERLGCELSKSLRGPNQVGDTEEARMDQARKLRPTTCSPAQWKDEPVFSLQINKGRRTITLHYVKMSWRERDGENLQFKGDPKSDKPLSRTQPLNAWFKNYAAKSYKFPHTSTFNLSFSKDDFTAYRELGRVLAHKFDEALNPSH